ncbi:MAG: hypothetical protein ACI4T9_01035 [Prevotella sp.]
MTFNVFFREDTTTLSFLQSIISKDPEKWSVLRDTFQGQMDCRLTLVDKSIETPFHCLLTALICRQLEEQLKAIFSSLSLFVPPVRSGRPGNVSSVNEPFDTTEHRNEFLAECFSKVLARDARVITKRNPIHCRDLKVSSSSHNLYLRFEGGIANGWRLNDRFVAMLKPKELLNFRDYELSCRNIFTHGFSKNGVFINIDLEQRDNAGEL